MLGNMHTIVICEKCRESRHFLKNPTQQSELPSYACPHAHSVSQSSFG